MRNFSTPSRRNSRESLFLHRAPHLLELEFRAFSKSTTQRERRYSSRCTDLMKRKRSPRETYRTIPEFRRIRGAVRYVRKKTGLGTISFRSIRCERRLRDYAKITRCECWKGAAISCSSMRDTEESIVPTSFQIQRKICWRSTYRNCCRCSRNWK